MKHLQGPSPTNMKMKHLQGPSPTNILQKNKFIIKKIIGNRIEVKYQALYIHKL